VLRRRGAVRAPVNSVEDTAPEIATGEVMTSERYAIDTLIIGDGNGTEEGTIYASSLRNPDISDKK